MKRQRFFLQTLILAALLMMPWVTQAQSAIAKVKEYDYSLTAAQSYASIASSGTCWTATDAVAGYTSFTMPFTMNFGQGQIPSGTTVYVSQTGYVSTTQPSGSTLPNDAIAPLYCNSFIGSANSVYHSASSSGVTVEWRKVKSGTSSYSFQLKVFPNGRIEFHYGPMTTNASITAWTGMKSSASDIFTAMGDSYNWDTIVPAYTQTTRTVSSTYRPAFSVATSTGMVYTFTQPTCVKPTEFALDLSTATSATLSWVSDLTNFQVKYSTDANFDPSTEGTLATATATSVILNGLQSQTRYYAYLRSNCSATSKSGWTDRITFLTDTSCLCPRYVSVSNGVVSWTENGTATQWQVKYGLTSADESTYTTELVSTNPYTLPNLLPNENYTVYVCSYCSATDQSTWSGDVNFTSPCSAVSIMNGVSHIQNFEGIFPPPCWSMYYASTGNEDATINQITQSTTKAHQGSFSLRFSSYSSASDYNEYLISPELNASAPIQLSFYYQCYGSGDNLYVGYSAGSSAVTSVDYTWSSMLPNSTNTWKEYSATIPANTKYIAFRYYGNYQYYLYIDDINISLAPTCPAPNGLSVSGSAVSWTENGTATQWQVKYGLTSADESTYITELVSTNPYTLPNLPPNENYTIYVCSYCSATDQSTWSEGVNFVTPCSVIAITDAVPYSQGFENATIPNCWTQEYVNGSLDWVFCAGTNSGALSGQSHSGEYNALFSDDGHGSITRLISPVFDLSSLTAVQLSFWHAQQKWGSDQDELSVYYRSSTTADWTLLVTYTNSISTWTAETLDLPNPSATYQIAFEGLANYGYGIALDDVQIKKSPTCYSPTDLVASTITGNSASISWTPSTQCTATQWEVAFGLAGFDPDSAENLIAVNTVMVANLTGLNGATMYEFYVRSVCSETDKSAWSVVGSFATTCGTIAINSTNSLIEDFEGSTFPSYCWNRAHTQGSSANQWIRNTTTIHQGTGSAQLQDQPVGNKNNLVSPLLNLSMGNYYMVSFWMFRSDYSTLKPNEGVKVWVNTTPDTIDGTTIAYIRRQYNLAPAVSATGWYQYAAEIPSSINGDVYVIFEGISEYGTASYIDDIMVSVAPSCFKPSNLVISSTTNSAEVAWTENSRTPATQWEIKYGENGFDLATEGTSVIVNTTPSVELTGLASATSYDVYVRALCSSTDNSEWSDVATFTTFRVPVSLPYAYGFDDGSDDANWILSNGTQTNQWVIGDAVNHGGLKSLYISSDGQTYNYNNGTSYVYASRTMQIEAGSNYQISFDWQAQGESTYDYIRAFLVPASVSLTAGSANGISTSGTPTNWIALDGGSKLNLQSTWQSTIYSFKAATSGYYNLVFYWKNDYSGGAQPAAAIDNIIIDQITCMPPADLTTAGVTATTANLSWTDNDNADGMQYDVRYALANDFDLDNPQSYTEQRVADTFYLVTGLQHSTQYTYQVRAVCGDDDASSWTAPFTFWSGCGAWDYDRLPYIENFDAVTGTTSSTIANHVLPTCWNYQNTGTSYSGYPIAYVSSSTSRSGNNCLRFYTYYSASSAYAYGEQYAILPEMAVAEMDTLEVSFYARTSSSTSYYSNAVIRVGVMTNPADVSTFAVVDSVVLPAATTYNQYTVSLQSYIGSGKYIALMVGQPILNGTNTNGYNSLYIDDLKVDKRMTYHPMTANANETIAICGESICLDTVAGGHMVNNANGTMTVLPATPGQVINLSGTLDCEYGYDYLSIYEGIGTTGTRLYYGTGSDLINVTSPNDVAALTIQFTSDMDGNEGYTGFNLLASCVCPSHVDTTHVIVDQCNSYTWMNGKVYTMPVSSIAQASSAQYVNNYVRTNVTGCDSVYYDLSLNLHPFYNFPFETYNICAGDTLTVHGQRFTESGEYTITLASQYGCDSVFHVNVARRALPVVAIREHGTSSPVITACAGTPLTLQADVTSASSYTMNWEDNSTDNLRVVPAVQGNIYTLTATNFYGCSATATTSVNTLPLPTLTLTAPTAICVGQPATLTAAATGCTYQWNTSDENGSIMVTPVETTTYNVTATDVNGCQSTQEAEIVVNALPVAIISAPTTICQNQDAEISVNAEGCSYQWNDPSASTAAAVTVSPMATTLYNVTLTDVNGCRNSYATTVTVNPVYAVSDNRAVCTGETYAWGSQTLAESGTYTNTFATVNSCDSVVTMNFLVQDTAVTNNYLSVCEGAEFTFHDVAYIAIADQTIDFSTISAGGCPAIDRLIVTVNPQRTSIETATSCELYTWNNEVYTESGNYLKHLHTIYGCDSAATLALTMNTRNTGVDNQEACERYRWIDGRTYTNSNNTATYTYPNGNVLGCDSTVTLNLTINRTDTTTVDVLTCDRTYTWVNGETYTESQTFGNVVYNTGIRNVMGCDSYQRLNLTMKPFPDTVVSNVVVCDNYVIHPVDCEGNTSEVSLSQPLTNYMYRTLDNEGNEQIVRLNLTIHHSDFHRYPAVACDNYVWSIDTNIIGAFNTTGTYTAQLTNPDGCEDVYILDLTINNSTTSTYNENICPGLTYTGHDFVNENVPSDFTLTRFMPGEAANGCDSTINVVLDVLPSPEATTVVTACGSYTWSRTNMTYDSTSANYIVATGATDPTTTCDSILYLDLTVNYPQYSVQTIQACDSYTWINGHTYTESISSVYDTLRTINGCDSVVALNLTVKPHRTGDTTVQACDSYTWIDGMTYTETTSDPTYTFANNFENGCDSVVTLNLTVKPHRIGDTTIQACDSYAWIDGETYTASTQTPTYTYQNNYGEGCDSIVTLNLIVNNHAVGVEEVTACNSYIWRDGVERSSSIDNVVLVGGLDENGCDSVITLNLTINNTTTGTDPHVACDSLVWLDDVTYYTDNTTATYNMENMYGCDSIVTLSLTVNHARYDTTLIVSNEGSYEYPAGSYHFYNGTELVPFDTVFAPVLTEDVTDHQCPVYSVTRLIVGIRSYGSDRITACDSYVWHGTTYSETGSYTTTIPTMHTHLDSVIFLNLTINRSTTSTQTENVCDSYTWNAGDGFTYDATGRYDYRTTNALGCDSVVTLDLTVRHATTGVMAASACDTYTWLDGLEYANDNTSATYHTTNVAGCDSLITLNLTMNYSNTGDTTAVACDFFTWTNGDQQVYTLDALPTHVYTNLAGCDSVVTLHLTVNHSTNAMVSDTACDSYTWNDQTFSETGIYLNNYTNSEGCPSTDTLNLTIFNRTDSTLMVIACDSYEWGTLYTSTPTVAPTMHYQNAVGCDSLVTLNLMVNHSTNENVIVSACDTYTWNVESLDGTTTTVGTYTENAVPTYTIQNAVGCDSLISLALTINPTFATTHVKDMCDSYYWEGTTYTASNNSDTHIYTAENGCDSVVTLDLSIRYSSVHQTIADVCDSYTWINGENYTESANLSYFVGPNAAGCDSTDTLMLTVRHMTHGTDTIITSEGSYFDNELTADGTYRFNNIIYSTGCYNFDDVRVGTNVAGCDSLVDYSLQVYSRVRNDVVVTACESYHWTLGSVDSIFTASTTYYDTLTSPRGYDSVMILHLTIDTPAYANYSVDRFPLSQSVYTYDAQNGFTTSMDFTDSLPGIYTYTYNVGAVAHCDSIVSVTVNVVNNYYYDTVHVCHDAESYLWATTSVLGTNETEAVTLPAATDQTRDAYYNFVRVMNPGTMSEDVFHLTVVRNAYRYGIEHRTACDSFTWIDGNTYTESTGFNFISFNLPSISDTMCDSTAMLDLTIRHSSIDSISVEACDSYTWNFTNLNGVGVTAGTYAESGTYDYTSLNTVGCDSTVVMNLSVLRSTTGTDTHVACDKFTWLNGTEYTVSNTIDTAHLTNLAGCDSLVTLNLTVNHNTSAASTVTACDSYAWINHDTIYTYSQSGVYMNDYLTADGCASTDTLILTVNYNTNTATAISACDSYIWNDIEYSTSGEKLFNYFTAEGCPSVDTLNLTINLSTTTNVDGDICLGSTYTGYDLFTVNTTGIVSGYHTYSSTIPRILNGCDSNVVLNLKVKAPTSSTLFKTSCEPYTWVINNELVLGPFANDTIVSVIIQNAEGCDSVMTLNFARGESVIDSITAVACDTYVWNHTDGSVETLTQSGNYSYRYEGATGECEHINRLALTINNSTSSSETAQQCDSYTWAQNGAIYLQSGDYLNRTLNADNCANVDTLHLTILSSTASTEQMTVCDSYTWNATTYTGSGVYTHQSVNEVGCPHVATLSLFVNHSTTSMTEATACDSYTWNGTTYHESAILTHDALNINGCPQTDTLVLTINNSNASTLEATACNSYNWNGTIYTASTNTPSLTIRNVAGCDSVITLNLTINNSDNVTINATACDSYTWNGQTYTNSGTYFYRTTNQTGCDSTVALNLTVFHNSSTDTTVVACDSYSWRGITYTAAGNYTNVFTNNDGCSSVASLHLILGNSTSETEIVSACDSYEWDATGATYTHTGVFTNRTINAQGCTHMDTLVLTVHSANVESLTATACDSYSWNGTDYTASGDYTVSGTNMDGCDSVTTLHLTINHSQTGTEVATSCGSYTWNGTEYTATGIYTVTGLTAEGCPRTLALNLTVNEPTFSTEVVTACDSYSWNGNNYNQSGTYTNTSENADGCEHISTLVLTLGNTIETTENVTACDSYTWNGNGTTYIASGNYTATNYDAANCAQITHLVLTINHSTTDTATATACDNYTWSTGNGQTYITSGSYVYTSTNATGCNNVSVINLVIGHSTNAIEQATACDSYAWNGNGYTATGMYSDTSVNAEGCQHVTILALTVNASTTAVETAAACDSYTWNNSEYTQSGDYTYATTNATGCSHVVTLNLTINYSTNDTVIVNNLTNADMPWNYGGSTYEDYGEYDISMVTVAGCDSLTHLVLNHNTGIDNTDALVELKLYPNPTQGRVTLTAENVQKVEVLDLVGRLVATFENTNTFDLSNLVEGVYTLRITLPEGTAVRKVVKK